MQHGSIPWVEEPVMFAPEVVVVVSMAVRLGALRTRSRLTPGS